MTCAVCGTQLYWPEVNLCLPHGGLSCIKRPDIDSVRWCPRPHPEAIGSVYLGWLSPSSMGAWLELRDFRMKQMQQRMLDALKQVIGETP